MLEILRGADLESPCAVVSPSEPPILRLLQPFLMRNKSHHIQLDSTLILESFGSDMSMAPLAKSHLNKCGVTEGLGSWGARVFSPQAPLCQWAEGMLAVQDALEMPWRCSWSSPIIPNLEVHMVLAQVQADMNLLWLPLSEVHRLKKAARRAEMCPVSQPWCVNALWDQRCSQSSWYHTEGNRNGNTSSSCWSFSVNHWCMW